MLFKTVFLLKPLEAAEEDLGQQLQGKGTEIQNDGHHNLKSELA